MLPQTNFGTGLGLVLLHSGRIFTAASDVDGFVSQLRALTDPAVHSAAAARSAEGHQRYTKAAVLSYWKNCYASLLPQAQPVPQARGDLHL